MAVFIGGRSLPPRAQRAPRRGTVTGYVRKGQGSARGAHPPAMSTDFTSAEPDPRAEARQRVASPARVDRLSTTLLSPPSPPRGPRTFPDSVTGRGEPPPYDLAGDRNPNPGPHPACFRFRERPTQRDMGAIMNGGTGPRCAPERPCRRSTGVAARPSDNLPDCLGDVARGGGPRSRERSRSCPPCQQPAFSPRSARGASAASPQLRRGCAASPTLTSSLRVADGALVSGRAQTSSQRARSRGQGVPEAHIQHFQLGTGEWAMEAALPPNRFRRSRSCSPQRGGELDVGSAAGEPRYNYPDPPEPRAYKHAQVGRPHNGTVRRYPGTGGSQQTSSAIVRNVLGDEKAVVHEIFPRCTFSARKRDLSRKNTQHLATSSVVQRALSGQRALPSPRRGRGLGAPSANRDSLVGGTSVSDLMRDAPASAPQERRAKGMGSPANANRVAHHQHHRLW